MNDARDTSEATTVSPAARARAVAPVIASAADRIEAARELTPEVLDALHGAGLFRCLLPRAFDGEEVHPAGYAEMVETIAAADASTAWCIGQGSGCSMAAAYLKPEIAREIWSNDRRAVLAWGMRPGIPAKVVDGGYRVTGQWHFASGSRHAQWLGAHCTVEERDGSLRLGPHGHPLERTLLFPRVAATIIDDWHVVGLRGTGSDSYAVTDLYVPDDYTLGRDTIEDRRERGPLYQFTSTNMYASGFAAVALGIARAALDAFVALAQEKTPRGAASSLRLSPVVQHEVALAEARLRAVRTLLLHTLGETFDGVVRRGEMTFDQTMSIRLVTTYAIRQAKEVMQTAWQYAGATAIFNKNPFERRFRDMHAVTQQVQARWTHFETVGQHLLGLVPDPRFI
jgi:alkylation response protein AidB-like acyl-CoA dehydrogenase